jgi:hypothetical protein
VDPCRQGLSSHCNSDTVIHAAECDEESFPSTIPHTPYSHDLASPDFYLFDYIKQLLLGCEFTDRDSLLQAVRDSLGGIEKAILEGVFCNWMERERLQQSSAMGGEYVE